MGKKSPRKDIANIWMLIAMVVTVRQALDYYSTLRAAGGWGDGLFNLRCLSPSLLCLVFLQSPYKPDRKLLNYRALLDLPLKHFTCLV